MNRFLIDMKDVPLYILVLISVSCFLWLSMGTCFPQKGEYVVVSVFPVYKFKNFLPFLFNFLILISMWLGDLNSVRSESRKEVVLPQWTLKGGSLPLDWLVRPSTCHSPINMDSPSRTVYKEVDLVSKIILALVFRPSWFLAPSLSKPGDIWRH